jgi:hypothetical protein
MLTQLDSAITFIQSQETGLSPSYALANRLRGFTKAAYTSKFWTIATGTNQAFIQGNLDGNVSLAGQTTDFGHFIAALSDQLNSPRAKLTAWTGDHTSWAGDLGSAITLWSQRPEKFSGLEEALVRFASESDLAANIAAYVIGHQLNTSGGLLSAAITDYDRTPFAAHVQQFVALRFGNGDLAPEIRRQITTYLRLASDSGLYGWLKGAVKGRFFPKKGYGDGEIDLATAYFVAYINRYR